MTYYELHPVKYTDEKIKIMKLRSDFDIQLESDLLNFFVAFLYYKKLCIHQ